MPSLIESLKKLSCSVPEGLSQDPYIEVFLQIVGPNQTDRLVHEFAIFGKSAVYDLKQPYFCGKQAQIAYWEEKTNE